MEYFAFQWHITDDCDQRCVHCYIFSEGKNRCIKQVSLEDAKKIIKNCEEMCARNKRKPYFFLTGGDPILHPHFWDILEIIHEHDIPFTIMGNPFHLTTENCAQMKQLGCVKYQLSIDGLRHTHDKIRKIGSFDTTLDAIDVLHDGGLQCAIMTTVSGTNIDEIPDIVDLVVEHNVDIFAFARYCPTSLDKSTHIEPLEYRDFLDSMWHKFKEYKNSETYFNLKDHLWTLYLYEKGLFKIDDHLDDETIYDGCNCANCHMTICPDGDVMACRRFESPIGNAFNETLYDLFAGHRIDKYRDYEKFEKCSQCELLRFCRGCPAVAYGYTHNFYAADPQCWKQI